MLRFIGNDKYLLDRLSLWRFGVQDKSSETRVRIPYYRNLDPLNPLVPCGGPNDISCDSASAG